MFSIIYEKYDAVYDRIITQKSGITYVFFFLILCENQS